MTVCARMKIAFFACACLSIFDGQHRRVGILWLSITRNRRTLRLSKVCVGTMTFGERAGTSSRGAGGPSSFGVNDVNFLGTPPNCSVD